MSKHNVPVYHSLHESTSDMMLSNVSIWRPSWAPKAEPPHKHQNETIIENMTNKNNCIKSKDNPRNQKSQYNGILTAQHVNSTVYCAICESKTFSPVTGMCMIDPHTSILKVIEIADSPTFVRTIHKLNVQNDIENLIILLPQSYRQKTTNFIKILESNLPNNVSVNFISDNTFRTSDNSLELICKSVREDERDSFKIELRHKKYGFSATCACIDYLQTLPNHIFIHENFNVKFESSEDSMFISSAAILDLELLESNAVNKTFNNLSLFKFLNSTMTKMGERLLRNNITQPLTNKSSLLLRYEAVDEFIRNDGIALDIRLEMKNLVDLDNLFSYLCKKPKENIEEVNQQKINFVLLLKKVLHTVINIRMLLESLESELIKEILKTFQSSDVNDVLELINEYINDECTWVNKPIELRNQKCYAVKFGHNGILDASRQLYKFLIDEVLKEIEDLTERYNIFMENKYDKNRGFFIFIKDTSLSSFEDLEDSPFINCIQKGNNIECNTMEIIKLNLRINSVLDEIFLMSEDTVNELISNFRNYVSTFFLISEAIALLDLICNFAVLSSKGNQFELYTCCKFEDKNVILKNSRHPLLEYVFNTDKNNDKILVKNDVTIVSDTSRVQIITGPNMSGKSIYIKQVAIIVILCQIGMFIPAEFASMKIFKSLFTRVSNDVTEPNISSFSMEMVEMSFILQNADEDSLIIIDELGRGTGYKDALALCISMVERIRRMRAVCLFVTHFVDIPKIFENKPGIFELHMGVTNSEELKQTFKIQPGINWISGYAIQMVEKKKLFPQNILDEAKSVSMKLKIAKDSALINDKLRSKQSAQNKLILNYYEMLNHIVHNVPDSELFAMLSVLENEFVDKYDSTEVSLVQDKIELAKTAPASERNDVINTNNADPTKLMDDLLDFGYLKS
jgi:DNA mismatch repair protein MSH4